MKNALKVLYIVFAGVGVFFINNIYLLIGVILFHLILFAIVKSENKNFKFLIKVKWFLLLILVFNAFTGSPDFKLLKIGGWVLSISFDGVLEGFLMALKVVAMLLITQVIRLSMKGKEFFNGIRALGLDTNTSKSIDAIFDILENDHKTKKNKHKNKRKEKKEEGEIQSKDILFKRKLGNIPKKLLKKIEYSQQQFGKDSVAQIASSALAITLIRMVKIAPGLPLAPGHKNVVLFPVFIHGIIHSNVKNAGGKIGFISGIMHFSMGFGKYGPLSILEFTLLGWVFDLLLKIPVKKTNIWFLVLIGGIGGCVRIITEISLAFFLGVPGAFYIIYLPYVISQIAFGSASGLVSRAILKTKNYESAN